MISLWQKQSNSFTLQSTQQSKNPTHSHLHPSHPSTLIYRKKTTKKIFKHWKESTTMSPSGRHLGHYKAILKCPDLITFHCIMASLPLQYGFAPQRWTKAIQIMLEKNPGKLLIHRLRGIIILEAG